MKERKEKPEKEIEKKIKGENNDIIEKRTWR